MNNFCYNTSDVKTLTHICLINLKPEVTSLLYVFMTNLDIFTEILEFCVI